MKRGPLRAFVFSIVLLAAPSAGFAVNPCAMQNPCGESAPADHGPPPTTYEKPVPNPCAPYLPGSPRIYIDPGYRWKKDDKPDWTQTVPRGTGTGTGTRTRDDKPRGEGDDPRDEPPPTVHGEEVEAPRYGIVLRHDESRTWVPTYGDTTTVTARIYEPDPKRPGVWRPSAKLRRVIKVAFVSRSDEPGRSMNMELGKDPEASPDLFFMPGEHKCYDDPIGTGYFGSCDTKAEVNEATFLIKSEDYGGYSRLEASCAGCARLVMVPPSDNSWPDAVEEPNPEKRHTRVPHDSNDNHIADPYPPERVEWKDPNVDDDPNPTGDGTAGDGLSAYEEYRGFHIRGEHHVRTDWNKKTLFVENRGNFPGIYTFSLVSGLEVYDITRDQHHMRIVNNQHGRLSKHHVTDQHALILKFGTASAGDGLLGYTSDFGPPKNVESVSVWPANHSGIYTVHDTVVHELGHAIGIRHHGDTGVWYETWHPPGTWRDYSPAHNVHTGPKLCGYNLPADVRFGHKHNQSSGVVDCYMRYEYHGRAFRQEDGSIDCIGVHPGSTLYCATASGTGFNAGDRAAGNATKGNCKSQIIINDK